MRVPEPQSVMADPSQVADYQFACETWMSLYYALTWEALYCAGVAPHGTALDLACGSGWFSRGLAHYLGQQVVGVDLAEPMLTVARKAARDVSCEHQLQFLAGDATKLAHIPGLPQTFDLTCMTLAAHHLDSMANLSATVQAMHARTAPDGIVCIMDLVRPRTQALTERFLALTTPDYARAGKTSLVDDTRHSMYAAWSPEEFAAALPKTPGRRFWQIVSPGVPLVQLLVGVPETRTKLFVRTGMPWTDALHPVPRAFRRQWRMLRWATLGRQRLLC